MEGLPPVGMYQTVTCVHIDCKYQDFLFFLSTPGGQPAALLAKDRELLHELNKHLLECSS